MNAWTEPSMRSGQKMSQERVERRRSPRLRLPWRSVATLAILLAAAGACAPPLQAPDRQTGRSAPDRGFAIAQRVCNDCHQISGDRPATGENIGPSFMAIARRLDIGPERLARAVERQHWISPAGLPPVLMPTFILTAAERADVAAYLLQLRDGSPADP